MKSSIRYLHVFLQRLIDINLRNPRSIRAFYYINIPDYRPPCFRLVFHGLNDARSAMRNRTTQVIQVAPEYSYLGNDRFSPASLIVEIHESPILFNASVSSRRRTSRRVAASRTRVDVSILRCLAKRNNTRRLRSGGEKETRELCIRMVRVITVVRHVGRRVKIRATFAPATIVSPPSPLPFSYPLRVK